MRRGGEGLVIRDFHWMTSAVSPCYLPNSHLCPKHSCPCVCVCWNATWVRNSWLNGDSKGRRTTDQYNHPASSRFWRKFSLFLGSAAKWWFTLFLTLSLSLEVVKVPDDAGKVAALASNRQEQRMTWQPDPGDKLYSTAARNEGRPEEEREQREKRRGTSPPLHGLSVSHRGRERQATMGPFRARLKVVI